MVVPDMRNPAQEQLLKLMFEKEKLENRIKDYGEILRANDNVGMDGPLLDAAQFPRNDIDVYAVRNARHQIICLQNDYKKMMKQIEELLHQVHSNTSSTNTQQELSQQAANMQLHEAQLPTNTATFAKVALVAPNSPAANAGLRAGDLLVEFGSVNSRNFNSNLTVIQSVVQNMQNRVVNLKVKRDAEFINLSLTPKTWSGNGLLGCSLHMLDSIER